MIDINRAVAFATYADDITRINETAHEDSKQVFAYYGKRTRPSDLVGVAQRQSEESAAAASRFTIAAGMLS